VSYVSLPVRGVTHYIRTAGVPSDYGLLVIFLAKEEGLELIMTEPMQSFLIAVGAILALLLIVPSIEFVANLLRKSDRQDDPAGAGNSLAPEGKHKPGQSNSFTGEAA